MPAVVAGFVSLLASAGGGVVFWSTSIASSALTVFPLSDGAPMPFSSVSHKSFRIASTDLPAAAATTVGSAI